jgi:hypothetical protein
MIIIISKYRKIVNLYNELTNIYPIGNEDQLVFWEIPTAFSCCTTLKILPITGRRRYGACSYTFTSSFSTTFLAEIKG